MRFSLAQLEAFYWIARLGSARAAARQLNVTQPTLSVRIRELERLLGVSLFERARRGLRLSAHGAAIQRHAEQVIGLAGDIDAYARNEAPGQTSLRIGAADFFAMTCLPRLLRTLERSYATLKVEVSVAFSNSIYSLLSSRELDLAFLTNAAPGENLVLRPLGKIPICWMAPPEIGISERSVRPADLADRHIITNPAPSHLFRSIHAWFSEGRVWPKRVSTCNTLSVMAQLAAEGVGITLLPAGMAQFDPWARQLRQLAAEPPLAPHRLYAAYYHDQRSTEIEQVIAEAATMISSLGTYIAMSGDT